MTVLPPRYRYLNYEPAPKMLLETLKLYGVEEVLGPGDNPVIVAWAKETKAKGYHHDSTAWCGLGQSVVAKRAGWEYQPGANALWALNWQFWGKPAPNKIAMLGDVLVKPRKVKGKIIGGHVTQYIGEDKTHYHCIGFNQSDACNIVRYPKSVFIAIRRAPWKRMQPPNVRRIMLGAYGPIAGKET